MICFFLNLIIRLRTANYIDLKNNEELQNFLVSDLRNKNGKIYCEIYDNTFLHYCGGSNWRQEGKEIHRYLTNKLKHTLLHLCK